MKRLMLAVFLLFGLGILSGCTGEPTGEIPFDYTEQVDAPTNLRIVGKVLQWDAVEGQTDYIVFADGVEKATVKATQYDFSSLLGSRIIFQVKTKGPRGMADSTFSASVAYQANPTQEAIEIRGIMLEYDMGEVPQGFVEEMIRKGMTADDMGDLLEAVQIFVSAIEANSDDPLAMNTALKTLMETPMNFEAIASAVLVTMAPNMIEEAIVELESDIEYYESMGEWYQDEIQQMETELAMYETIQTMLEDNTEATLIALVETFDQLEAFQEDIDNELISMVTSLFEGEFVVITNINSQEIILILDELVTILNENLPTMEYMILMMEVVESMVASTTTDQETIDTFVANKSYYAAEAILSMQAAIAMIDIIDVAFIDEVKDIAQDMAPESIVSESKMASAQMAQFRMVILLLEYYDKFLGENDDLIDQMDEVFSEKQKEAMYVAYMADLDPEMIDDEILYSVLVSLPYAQVSQLSDLSEKAKDALLDSFVASDGKILLLIAEMGGFDKYFYESEYYNNVTGETYDNETAFNYAKNQVTVELIGEVLIHLGAVADVMTSADMEFIATLIADNYPISDIIEDNSLTESEVTTLRNNLRNMMEKQLPKVLQLIQDLTEFIDDDEVIADILQEFVAINTYYVAEYGADYYNSNGYVDDRYEQYAMVILVSGVVDQFMNSTHTTIAENLIKAVTDFMITSEMLELLDGEKTEIEGYEENMLDALDFLLDEAKVFKGYNKATINATQKERIDSFSPDLMALFAE